MELLNFLASAFQKGPWPTLWLSTVFLYFGSIITAQIISASIYWIDDRDNIPDNHIHKLIAKLLNMDYYGEEEVFFGFWILGGLIGSAIFATAILYWWVSVWILTAFGILYIARSGRRLQKKLTAHINNKDIHNNP